ncbi:MAG: hypothetical protein ACLSTO_02865 [Bilophila wadsworthia]
MPLFAAMVAILSTPVARLERRRPQYAQLSLWCAFTARRRDIPRLHPARRARRVGERRRAVSMSLKLFERPVYSHAPICRLRHPHRGGLIALGIAFSGPYKIESEPTMAMGETVKVGQFEVTFKPV